MIYLFATKLGRLQIRIITKVFTGVRHEMFDAVCMTRQCIHYKSKFHFLFLKSLLFNFLWHTPVENFVIVFYVFDQILATND